MATNNKPSWTPGPWAIGAKTDGFATSVVSATETVWYQSAGGKVPLLISSMAARDKAAYREMDANARLIAAAPEMAEALTLFTSLTPHCGEETCKVTRCVRERAAWRDAVAAARSALKKARRDA